MPTEVDKGMSRTRQDEQAIEVDLNAHTHPKTGATTQEEAKRLLFENTR